MTPPLDDFQIYFTRDLNIRSKQDSQGFRGFGVHS
jgi:hypothetical protein